MQLHIIDSGSFGEKGMRQLYNEVHLCVLPNIALTANRRFAITEFDVTFFVQL